MFTVNPFDYLKMLLKSVPVYNSSCLVKSLTDLDEMIPKCQDALCAGRKDCPGCANTWPKESTTCHVWGTWPLFHMWHQIVLDASGIFVFYNIVSTSAHNPNPKMDWCPLIHKLGPPNVLFVWLCGTWWEVDHTWNAYNSQATQVMNTKLGRSTAFHDPVIILEWLQTLDN